jgi:hypothetical protein
VRLRSVLRPPILHSHFCRTLCITGHPLAIVLVQRRRLHSLMRHAPLLQLTSSTCGIVVQSRPPLVERPPSRLEPNVTHPPHCSRSFSVLTHSYSVSFPAAYAGHDRCPRGHWRGRASRLCAAAEGDAGLDPVVEAVFGVSTFIQGIAGGEDDSRQEPVAVFCEQVDAAPGRGRHCALLTAPG